VTVGAGYEAHLVWVGADLVLENHAVGQSLTYVAETNLAWCANVYQGREQFDVGELVDA